MICYVVQYEKPDFRPHARSGETMRAVKICETYEQARKDAEDIAKVKGRHVHRIVFQNIDTTGKAWIVTENVTLWENADK